MNLQRCDVQKYEDITNSFVSLRFVPRSAFSYSDVDSVAPRLLHLTYRNLSSGIPGTAILFQTNDRGDIQFTVWQVLLMQRSDLQCSGH